jgi:hypothetical protein
MLPILLAILLLAGCASPADEPAERPCLPEGSGVVFVDELAGDDECPFGAGPCTDEYLAFPGLAAQWSNPLSDQDFEDVIYGMDSGTLELVEGPLTAEDFRAAVLRGARIDFLTDTMDSTELRVSEAEDEFMYGTDEPAVIRYFQLDDPWVGRLWGIVAHPEGAGPFPTVIGIHGHTEDAEEWMISRGGFDLVNRGYAVIFPTMRANESAQHELLVTETLLRADLSFAGLRIYEHLLTLRYAAALDVVDRCRVGMMGHSGGAVLGNATIRAAAGVSAWVSDLSSGYYLGGPQGGWGDETSPGLYALADLINDFATAPMPVFEVGYNFEVYGADPPIDLWPEVASFLDEQLLGP